MSKDLNKKITNISYNSLHLPKQLTINDVVHKYTYAADGRKLKVVQGGIARDYAGSIIYENGSLKRILIEGGYIESCTYYYYFNDHLGNVRAVASAGCNTVKCNHYYPFGLPMAETTNTAQNTQPYKYNGKEFERKDGLNWMDYGARNYDAALGRFRTMDPLAEKYYGVSSYAYVANNPVKYVDLTGDSISVTDLYVKDKHGNFVNPNQVKAFEFLASTKEGEKLLANYASKGQMIANISFSKDGKFHKKGINIMFGTKISRSFSSGSTSFTLDRGNLNIRVGVGISSDIGDLLDTFIHEIVIHADQSSIDYKNMNNSNAYQELRKMNKSRSYTQHWQERNVNRAMERIGIPILQQYYRSQGIVKSKDAILKMVYGFLNN